jgi:hypothetical protein
MTVDESIDVDVAIGNLEVVYYWTNGAEKYVFPRK